MLTATVSPALSRQDWLAAHVGAHDADSIGCRAPAVPSHEKTRLKRWMTRLFGDNAPMPLADPRLEAVRRFACATRAGKAPDGALIGELHQRGLDDAELAAIARFAA
ncbi:MULTISPECIES: hypothetical protein [unclassified Novosphingobium]|uniref:hypothetical protein n=1 Tax=Novosphingobium TaxID=165696 RepID=UPI001817317A|nr:MULTISPECIES: hypothetical protein [unclassified Novosphingobium]NKJ42078.1 hypothetical protein [Novosphingobium sp. SG720]NMN04467.1 hypothetical protein [Novosphingobium sp. SG919]NMN85541.1 hypothetical protein [Novosphingobium sp. SG916]